MKAETKLGPLVSVVEEIAKCRFDGHFSLFSFTTNYKGCFGTPQRLDGYGDDDEIEGLPAHASLEELLYYMVERPDDYIVPPRKEVMTNGQGA